VDMRAVPFLAASETDLTLSRDPGARRSVDECPPIPRCSCRSPLANQMRLILHTAAYWLILTVRDAVLS
jgi:hypothetical protein